jgi:hypothetical protein
MPAWVIVLAGGVAQATPGFSEDESSDREEAVAVLPERGVRTNNFGATCGAGSDYGVPVEVTVTDGLASVALPASWRTRGRAGSTARATSWATTSPPRRCTSLP